MPLAEKEHASAAAIDLSSPTADRRDPLSLVLRRFFDDDWIKFWFAALLVYGPLEKLVLPYLGGYFNLSGGLGKWTPHVEALLTGFVEFPLFLAFYLWSSRAIGLLLDSLRQNQIFADEKRFEDFTRRLLMSFNQGRWSLLALGSALLAMILMHFVVWGPETAVPPWFGDRVAARLFALCLIGLAAYAVAQVFFREVLTVVWLRRLWAELDDCLVIHPYHADGVGGLGGVGRHMVSFSVFVTVVLLFIVMAAVLPSLLHSGDTATLSLQFWSPLVLLIWVAYLLVVPLMFFVLTWPPHKAMEAARAVRLSVYAQQLDEQLKFAEAGARGKQVDLPDTLKKINDLKQARAVILQDWPMWPISVESTRFLGLTSIIPTAYSALTFVVGLFK